MKRITYLFTVALLLFTAISCKHNQDEKILKSKKKIKDDGSSVIWTYDRSGRLIEYNTFYSTGKPNFTIKYDSQNRILCWKWFYDDGYELKEYTYIDEDIAEEKYSYVILKDDGSEDLEQSWYETNIALINNTYGFEQLSKFNSYFAYYNFIGQIYYINDYFIDSNGNINSNHRIYTKKGLPISSLKETSIDEYEYDSNMRFLKWSRDGSIIEAAEYDAKGNLICHSRSSAENHATYDKNNNVISIISSLGWKKFWEYDEKNNEVYYKTIGADEKVTEIYKTYNEYNDVISEKTVKDGVVDTEVTYTWEYEYY